MRNLPSHGKRSMDGTNHWHLGNERLGKSHRSQKLRVDSPQHLYRQSGLSLQRTCSGGWGPKVLVHICRFQQNTRVPSVNSNTQKMRLLPVHLNHGRRAHRKIWIYWRIRLSFQSQWIWRIPRMRTHERQRTSQAYRWTERAPHGDSTEQPTNTKRQSSGKDQRRMLLPFDGTRIRLEM